MRASITASLMGDTKTSAISTGQREIILVVDDDTFLRAHVLRQLTVLGYRSLDAASCRDALEVLKHVPDVDLLFTDLVMPSDMGGIALAEAARSINPALKVLFTSGYSETALAQSQALPPGADFLGKPYRRAELAATLRMVLERN